MASLCKFESWFCTVDVVGIPAGAELNAGAGSDFRNFRPCDTHKQIQAKKPCVLLSPHPLFLFRSLGLGSSVDFDESTKSLLVSDLERDALPFARPPSVSKAVGFELAAVLVASGILCSDLGWILVGMFNTESEFIALGWSVRCEESCGIGPTLCGVTSLDSFGTSCDSFDESTTDSSLLDAVCSSLEDGPSLCKVSSLASLASLLTTGFSAISRG
jgi:hypothetical protein